MVNRTSLLATDPNRKLESRTRTRSVSAGYTTLSPMGSGTLGAAASPARLMREAECTVILEGAVLVPGVALDWHEQPRAVTTSASAIPENRLTSIVAR